jgi:hypothetical protein
MIQIRYESGDVIVTIPKDQASAGFIQEFLERGRIDAVLGRSQAGNAAIEALAEEIDAAWWAEHKDAFLAGTSGSDSGIETTD